MDEQEIQRLQKLSELVKEFSTNGVTSEEVTTLFEVLIQAVEGLRAQTEELLASSSRETQMSLNNMAQYVGKLEAQVSESASLSESTKQLINKKTAELRNELEQIRESIPEEVDVKPLESKVNRLIDQPASKVKEKLESLKGEERLDKAAIKGLDDLENEIKQVSSRQSISGGMTQARVLQLISESGGGSGDMEASTYDPQGIEGDAFDTDNHTDGTTNKVFTAVEKTKLSGIEASADVTDAGNVGAVNAAATSKATPVNADSFPIVDSEAANVIKRLTFTNLKAFLKTYFDTLYAAALGADDNYVTDAEKTKLSNLSGTNTGDQTSIVGITGTKAQFDTAVTDGNFLFSGDVTQYTDELAQDAVGGILGVEFTYDDATPSIVLATGGIDETKLDASVNASLDLADTAVQDLADLGVTASASELNTLDGVTASTAELNFVDGVTSAIQTQLDDKLSKTGGTMSGNVTLGENASLDLDPALSADGKYSGICITGTAGATLAFGDLIYLSSSDSRWELADADAASTSQRLLGMCVLAAAADGDPTKILLQGNIRADAAFPALTIGSPAYVGETAGDIQTAIPTGADNVVRVVGYALTADELMFNPSPTSQVTVA
jgi:hypothetical protein